VSITRWGGGDIYLLGAGRTYAGLDGLGRVSQAPEEGMRKPEGLVTGEGVGGGASHKEGGRGNEKR